MGCTETQDKRSKEVSFFIKYVNLTKLHYMDESPLRRQENENNPIAWKAIILQILNKIKIKHEWQSYSNEIQNLLESKSIEKFMKPVNSKSWMDYTTFIGCEKYKSKKQQKTSCEVPKVYKKLCDTYNEKHEEKELKKFSEFLIKEMSSLDHIISDIVAQFSELFLNKYMIFFGNDCSKIILDPSFNVIASSFKKDLKILLIFLKEVIERLYMNIIMCNPILKRSKNRRNEFIDNILSGIVFSSSNNIYYTLFSLYGILNKEKENKMDNIMERLKNIFPLRMEINEKFALEKSNEPYATVINSIKEMSISISPIEKFKKVCRIKEEIIENVDRYWETHNPNLSADNLVIDSDQLITIFTFCIVKSRDCKIVSYREYIKEFMNENIINNGPNAYYFTTFDVSIDYLIRLSEEELIKLSL